MDKYRELSDDPIEASEATIPEIVALLQNFQVGQCWRKSFPVSNPQDVSKLNKAVELLRDAGLDIGHGNAQFGFKMPLPAKDSACRTLEIFRRR